MNTFHRKFITLYRVTKEMICQRQDFRKFAKGAASLKGVANIATSDGDKALLIISGGGMNVLWAQIWSVLSVPIRMRGYRGLVLTTRHQKILNKYFSFFGLELIYFDDLAKDLAKPLPPELDRKIQGAENVSDYRGIEYRGIPVGEIAVSTFSRNHGTGVVQLTNSSVVKKVNEYISLICNAAGVADYVYRTYKVEVIFTAEIFFEEYGAFYYMALAKEINIIKFTGTVRDDAFILQHLTRINERHHHASLTDSAWEVIKQLPYNERVDVELKNNFLDRYGDKWHRARRNFAGTRIMPVEEARKILGISNGRKVAVIYSHILYDSIFFFGTDLFSDYATWLLETVRAACQNKEIDWLIKVHPSNLWRGELNSLLKGRFEEERLIYGVLGDLPPHVRIVAADTEINPYTWFQLADYGITVRGTSGLEMAALGKTVITAGTGRYEGKGFTLDAGSKEEYLKLLLRLPDIPPLSGAEVELAKKYAYGLFVLKPFVLTSLVPTIKSGVTKVVASDDLIYVPRGFGGKEMPQDLSVFANWALDKDNLELFSEWRC